MSRGRNNTNLLIFPMATGPPDCNRFNSCSAPLCPLDLELDRRVWYADEPVCESRKHSLRRWIRKQRLIKKRKYKKWLEKPVTYQMIYDVSRPPQYSDETRRKMAERMRHMQARNNSQIMAVG